MFAHNLAVWRAQAVADEVATEPALDHLATALAEVGGRDHLEATPAGVPARP